MSQTLSDLQLELLKSFSRDVSDEAAILHFTVIPEALVAIAERAIRNPPHQSRIQPLYRARLRH